LFTLLAIFKEVIMNLSETLQGLNDFLGDVTTYAKDTVSSWDELYGIFNPPDDKVIVIPQTQSQTQPQTQPPINYGISAADFAFKPYYPLLIGGAVLLIVALLLKK
jgi:hypothetical protein